MIRIFIITLFFFLSGLAAHAADPGEEALRNRMIKAGALPGYLQPSTLPDGIALLPPPPAEGTAAAARDREANERVLAEADAARRERATSDASTAFPGVTTSFSCALGLEIGEATTPALYRMMRRTLADFGLATRPAKQRYMRARPFVVNGKPLCTPQDIDTLRGDGSYPSGHSAYGFGWGLLLASVAPERGDALIRRGIDYGDSRQVCNVHWQSDVEQGRVLAAAVFARLQAADEFRQDFDAARREVATARSNGVPPPAACPR